MKMMMRSLEEEINEEDKLRQIGEQSRWVAKKG